MTTQTQQRQRDACREQLRTILAEIPILEVEAEADPDAETARPSRRNSGLTVDRYTLRAAGRTLHLAAVYTADALITGTDAMFDSCECVPGGAR